MAAQQSMQSSMRKSVNFKDKIPIKRDDNDEQKKKTIKFDQSESLEND